MVPIILSPTSDFTKTDTMDFHLNGGSQIWFLENQNFGIGKNVMTIMFRIKNNPPIFQARERLSKFQVAATRIIVTVPFVEHKLF